MKPYFHDETTVLYRGDCREVLPELDQADAIVTDPPYGLSFMGKGWDHAVPGVEFWQAALQAAKPGAWLLAFGGTRTYHRLMGAIEDAGWELRDCIMWVYGTGFPKSLDVSKAIDREAGAEREVVGTNPHARSIDGAGKGYENPTSHDPFISKPATPAAHEWYGWGTALKPAWEPIVVCRKPLDGTVAQNVLRYGVGGLNIDATRISVGEGDDIDAKNPHTRGTIGEGAIYGAGKPTLYDRGGKGRWPANLIHDGSDEAVAGFPTTRARGNVTATKRPRSAGVTGYGRWGGESRGLVDPGDEGSAARFFYCAKASRAEREAGLEALEPVSGADAVGREKGAAGMESPRAGAGRTRPELRNDHPTVKPIALMRYLCRLVTPSGGVVLDPFAGSGSTLVAARREGFRATGIEIDERACEIAAKRMAQGVLPLAVEPEPAAAQGSLFEGG